MSKDRWYYNPWFVLLMLFFVLGPLGLPLVWKNPRFSRTVKALLTLAMAVLTYFTVIVAVKAYKAAVNHFNQLNLTLPY